MYRKIVWCYVFVLTLLDISLNTKLSAQGKSHGVTVHDSLIEGITFQEWGSESGEGEGGGAGRGRAAPADALRLAPRALSFGRAALAAAHTLSVTLTNTANTTMHLASVAGTTPDFHASFFESKTLAPQANTSFSVVYLGRREGPVSAHLYIHTSLGVHKYPVSAVGVASEWRVWPLVGVRVPLNATVAPLLTLHNPTDTTVQVSEVYSSGSWIGLELPEGGESAPREQWAVPPHSTRSIVRLHIQPHQHHHHQHNNQPLTAYIRIKANITGGGLVVGVEARGVPPGEYLSPLHLRLRDRGSRDPADTYNVEAGNSLGSSVSLEGSVWGARCGSAPPALPAPPAPPHAPLHNGQRDKPTANGVRSAGVLVTLERPTLEAHQQLTKAAQITFDYQKMWEEYAASSANGEGATGAEEGGEAWCAGWVRVGRAALPYSVRLLPGTVRLLPDQLHFITSLGEEALRARDVTLVNEFPTPVRVTGVHCPAALRPYLHVEMLGEGGVEVAARAAVPALRVRLRGTRPSRALAATITLRTNLTDYVLPVMVYSGELDLEWEWPNSSAEELRLGAVGTSSTRRVALALHNPAPAALCVTELRAELPGAQLAIAACAHRDRACSCIPAWGRAQAWLTVVAPARAGALAGAVVACSAHACSRSSVTLHAHAGRLHAHPLHLYRAAPYAWSTAPLVLESSMSLRMRVVNVTQPAPDPAVTYVPVSGEVSAGRHAVGDVVYAPEELCRPHCYTGLDVDAPEGLSWLRRSGSRSEESLAADAALQAERYERYARTAEATRNVSLYVHTTQVVQIPVTGGVQWWWPRVWAGGASGGGALAGVGAGVTLRVAARNPSRTHHLLLRALLYHRDHSLAGQLESSFCKSEKCIWSEDAFKLSEWRATRGVVRPWSESSAGPGEGDPPPDNHTDHVLPMLLLAPDAEIEIKITFMPKEPSALTTYLYLRNNLTIIESVQLFGRGAYPSFDLGGRRPGAAAPLLFEVTDCAEGGSTVRRTVMARNTGAVPVRLRDWRVGGAACQGRGFRLHPCAPLALQPNESRALHLAFTADYTLARVPARLLLRADSVRAEFALLGAAPARLLPRCYAAAPRPPFEPALRAAGTLLALAALALVLAAAALDAERELRRARAPRPAPAPPHASRAPLDLRALANEPLAVPTAPATCRPPRPTPPPARRRRPTRRAAPLDPQAERRAFERWRNEVLRSGDDDDSRSSEDADVDQLPPDAEDAPLLDNEVEESTTDPPEPAGTDCSEADREIDERPPDAGDEDAVSTGSGSASSSPVEEHDAEDVDEHEDEHENRPEEDHRESPVIVNDEAPAESAVKPDATMPPAEAPARAARARREPGDTPRRAERTRSETEAGRARSTPAKHHARKEKVSKRRSERPAGSPPRASPPHPPAAVRWGASWSSVVAARAPSGGPVPSGGVPAPGGPSGGLAPIGSDVRRRAEPEPRPAPVQSTDNSLFFFNGEAHAPTRPDTDFAWRPSPPADRPSFVTPQCDYLEEPGVVGSGAYRPMGSVWGGAVGGVGVGPVGSGSGAAWSWGAGVAATGVAEWGEPAPLRPPPGFGAAPAAARTYDPFRSLASIWAPGAPLQWRHPSDGDRHDDNN